MNDSKKTFRERSDISLFGTLANKMNVVDVNGRKQLYFSVSVGQGDNQVIFECVMVIPMTFRLTIIKQRQPYRLWPAGNYQEKKYLLFQSTGERIQ